MYDFLKAMVGLIAQRNQFLLVFQSMLFAALGVMMGKETFFPLWVIIVLGLVTSVAWLYVNAVTHTNEAYIEDQLKELDPRFLAVVSARKRYPPLAGGDGGRMVAFFFPSFMVVVWAALLVFYVV